MKPEMKFEWRNGSNENSVLLNRKGYWQGLKIMHSRSLAGELKEFVPSYHEINITLAGSLNVYKQSAIGNKVHRCANNGNLCITPVGQTIRANWEDKIENLALFFEPKFVEQIALENNFSSGFEITESYEESDPLIQHMGLALLNEITSGSETDQLYADTLSQSLVIHLLKNYSVSDTNTKEAKGGLPGFKLKRVKEFINSNLENNPSLAEIAEIAGLSRYHFSRSFRKSTGMTPQQYVMQQRVERAKLLLRDKDLPIVEVSLQTGFKNQSHFTNIFRKFTKITPRNWREIKAT